MVIAVVVEGGGEDDTAGRIVPCLVWGGGGLTLEGVYPLLLYSHNNKTADTQSLSMAA